MTSRGYENFTDLFVDFHHELDHIHDFSGYSVDGFKYALIFWYHEQTQVVHQLDVNQDEAHHISTLCRTSSCHNP